MTQSPHLVKKFINLKQSLQVIIQSHLLILHQALAGLCIHMIQQIKV